MFVWGFGDYINVHLGNMARPPRFFHIISLLLFNIFFHCVDKKEEQNSRIFHALFVSCLTSFILPLLILLLLLDGGGSGSRVEVK